MINLIHQGKINRQFWGKCHFSKTPGLQFVTWGGGI